MYTTRLPGLAAGLLLLLLSVAASAVDLKNAVFAFTLTPEGGAPVAITLATADGVFTGHVGAVKADVAGVILDGAKLHGDVKVGADTYSLDALIEGDQVSGKYRGAANGAIVGRVGPRVQRFIGHRNDGTGVYPADCAPVSTWNEWDFKPVTEGRATRLEPVKENRKNIVWKTPLDNHCNGGMIVVGGKLFMMVDRGGYGYATRLVPEHVGPLLVCMDPKDGAILWKEDVNHLDKLPEADREKVRREVLACCAFWVETYSVHAKWYGLANKAVKGTALTEEEEGRYREAAEAYRKYIPDMPLASAEVKDSKYARYTGGYVQTTFWNVEKDVFKDWSARRSALTKYGYNWNAWFGQSSFVGSAMPTPVSDGKFLYVNTGYNDAFCYDLDGKRVWSAWFGPQGASWGSYITSPVLVGDVLIVHGGEGQHSKLWYRGLNKKTGEKLWQYDYNQSRGASYIMPTPSVLSLPLGDTGKMVDCIWTGAGDVLRASDGKLLAEKLGCHGNARPAGVEGDVVILANGSADGGAGKAWTYPQGITAIRLKAEAEDKVTAELLWNKPEMPSVVTAHKGIVYAAMRGDLAAFDVEKGTELARLKKVMLPNHLLSVVGDHLFGLDDVGVCLVATLGKDMKLVAANRLGTRVYAKYDFFNQGAQPFFSGNRVFIRSYTDVYCIGNPEEAMRLSAAHGGE